MGQGAQLAEATTDGELNDVQGDTMLTSAGSDMVSVM